MKHPHGYPFVQGLWANLSRSYIDRNVLLLLFILVQLVVMLYQLRSEALHLKDLMQIECGRLEDAGSSFMSLPHTMASIVNQGAVDSARGSLNLTIAAIKAGLELIKNVLEFFVSSYKSLLRCILQAIVDAGIALLKEQIQQFQSFLQQTVDGSTNVVNTVGDGVQNAGRSLLGVFGVKSQDNQEVPKVTVPDTLVTAVQSISINTSALFGTVEMLYDGAFKFVDDQIDFVKQGVHIPDQLFNIPDPVHVQFCDGIHTDWIDQIAEVLQYPLYAGIIMICIAILIMIIANSVVIWYNHTGFEQAVDEHIETAQYAMDEFELRVKVHQFRRPRVFWLHRTMASCLPTHLQIRCRWFLDYICHTQGIMIFMVGCLGLILCQLSYTTLHQVESQYLPEAKQRINQIAMTAINATNDGLAEYTDVLINGTNIAINETQQTMNEQFLGPIQNLTQTLNTTMNGIVEDTRTFLEQTLTLQALGPVTDQLFNCVRNDLLLKFTFVVNVVDHLQFKLPQVNPKLLHLNSTLLMMPVDKFADAILGKPTKDGHYSGGLSLMLQRWRESIDRQYYFSKYTAIFGSMLFIQGILGVVIKR